jgi:hypothetical protein
MDNNANGYGAVSINYGTPSTAEMLQQGAALNERRSERNQEFAYRKQQQQKADYWKGLNYIDDQTDASKYMTGLEQADHLSQQQLAAIHDKYVQQLAGGADIMAISGGLSSDVGRIAQADNAIKSKITEEDARIKAAAQKNKNINSAALMGDVRNGIANDYLMHDKDGNITYKPYDQLPHQQDYTSSLLGENAWKYSNGASDLITGLQKLKGDERSVFHKNGDGSITTYAGSITPYHQLNVTPDAGGYVKQIPQLDIMADTHNTVTDANGKPMKALPSDVFNNQLYNSDENKMQFDYLWNNYKQHAGIETTPQTEDALKRAFAYQLVSSNVQNQMYPKNVEHLPPQPRITVNTGSQVPVYDLYGDMVKSVRHVGTSDTPGTGVATLDELPQKAVDILLPHLQKVWGKADSDEDGKLDQFTAKDIKIGYDGNQLRAINYKTGDAVNIDKNWVNLLANGSVKQDMNVIANAPPHKPTVAQQQPIHTEATKHFKGLPTTGKF